MNNVKKIGVRLSLVMNDTGKGLSSAQVPQDTPAPTLQASSAFERWRRKAMLVTGLGVTEGERLENLKHDQIMHCERKKDWLMNYSACFVWRKLLILSLRVKLLRSYRCVHDEAFKAIWL